MNSAGYSTHKLHILFHFRTSIESSYSHEVDQIRKQYSKEDKKCIENFIEARNFSLKSEKTSQKTSLTDFKMIEVEGECDLSVSLPLSHSPSNLYYNIITITNVIFSQRYEQ